MCEECGCGTNLVHDHEHTHEHQDHKHEHKKIDVGEAVLTRNNRFADANRQKLSDQGIFTINLISSPGSGKTTLLEAMAKHFGKRMAVIEGDVQTRRDADRVEAAGAQAHQIETQGACHLDAHGVGHAMEHLNLDQCEFLVIENVGNLVCPSTYDLGENIKVGMLSVPEGDDKVLKYPALFLRIQAMLISKTDLLPHIEFDTDRAASECRSLNKDVAVFHVAAKTGNGMADFFNWLEKQIANGK